MNLALNNASICFLISKLLHNEPLKGHKLIENPEVNSNSRQSILRMNDDEMFDKM